MAVIIPNVTNWSVTPQNGQEDYFTKMNVWLSESTSVISSLSTAITKINESNSESNSNLNQVLTARDQTVAARNEAVSAIATLTAGAIDDTTIASNKAFSNQFITNNYYKKSDTYNKTEVDNKININGFTDKVTPIDTDHIGIQETDGLLKKLSFTNLKNWILALFQPTLTGTATFTSSSNQIIMSNIVVALGLEVGDVIQFISGTDANNGKMRTVESIIDNNTIIVNYEHCGARGNGSLKLSDQTGITCTVKLISKYYNASTGLGQDWVTLTSFRTLSSNYTNNTKREIKASVAVGINGAIDIRVSGIRYSYTTTISGSTNAQTGSIDSGLIYNVTSNVAMTLWRERR